MRNYPRARTPAASPGRDSGEPISAYSLVQRYIEVKASGYPKKSFLCTFLSVGGAGGSCIAGTPEWICFCGICCVLVALHSVVRLPLGICKRNALLHAMEASIWRSFFQPTRPVLSCVGFHSDPSISRVLEQLTKRWERVITWSPLQMRISWIFITAKLGLEFPRCMLLETGAAVLRENTCWNTWETFHSCRELDFTSVHFINSGVVRYG